MISWSATDSTYEVTYHSQLDLQALFINFSTPMFGIYPCYEMTSEYN